jgi:hypothetical protein
MHQILIHMDKLNRFNNMINNLSFFIVCKIVLYVKSVFKQFKPIIKNARSIITYVI